MENSGKGSTPNQQTKMTRPNSPALRAKTPEKAKAPFALKVDTSISDRQLKKLEDESPNHLKRAESINITATGKMKYKKKTKEKDLKGQDPEKLQKRKSELKRTALVDKIVANQEFKKQMLAREAELKRKDAEAAKRVDNNPPNKSGLGINSILKLIVPHKKRIFKKSQKMNHLSFQFT